MERKRSSISIEQGSLASFVSKRSKSNDLCNSSKERKENLSDKISVLQQLVSPYGKVLSGPYVQSNPMNKLQEGNGELYSLRSNGLCLVPIAYAVGIAVSNGADIWAPIKTTATSRF